jgi:hypothetical protein
MHLKQFYSPKTGKKLFNWAIGCCLLILLPFVTFAQQPAANLDQIRNGPPDDPISPANYVNGNVGAQTAHFIEGYSISYRAVLTDLPTDGTVISIIFEYDTKHQTKHALDFLTHYDNIEPHLEVFGHGEESINPRQDYEATVPAGFVTTPIPVPPMVNTPVPGEPAATFNALPAGLKLMTLYGGNFSGANPITYVLAQDLQLADASVQFQVDFVATNSTAILAWGGHIATQDTWGTGNSAVDISGSPYHMRLIDWNLNNLGNQDRSCNAAAVYFQPPCDFTGPSDLCASEVGTYTVLSTDPDYTYEWSIAQNGTNAFFVGGVNNTASVDINAGTQAGSFTVTVIVSNVDNGFEISNACEMVVDVNPAPPCTITGDDEVCPNVTTTYSGPAGDYTYVWSVTGNASIDGSNTGQTVDIVSGTTCPGAYTVSLEVNSADGCSSTCELDVTVGDDVPPTIVGVGSNQTIYCPAVPVFSNPTATDPCDGNPVLTFVDVTTPGACPQEYSVTRTWTATDACGGTSTASQTITVEDNTPPSITGVGGPQTITCPSTPVFSNPSASDACDATPTLTFADVTTPGSCPQEYSVTRTWTATDDCGNSSAASQTITVEDNTPPSITGVGGAQTIT